MPKAPRTCIHQLGKGVLQVHANSGPPDKPRVSFSVGNNLSQHLWVYCSQLAAQTTAAAELAGPAPASALCANLLLKSASQVQSAQQ